MLKKFIMLWIVLGVLPFAQAAGGGSGSIEFQADTRQISELCSDMECPAPYGKEIVFQLRGIDALDPRYKKILKRIAHTQSQIWGDTILEGDYAADGKTRLDRVQELYKSNKKIGYLITYSERAWDTSECRYDGINDDTLKDCKPGRIIVSSYVSLDFRDFFYDDITAAVFK